MKIETHENLNNSKTPEFTKLNQNLTKPESKFGQFDAPLYF